MLSGMRWTDVGTINTMIAGFSALMSLLALLVAFRAYRANYQLAEKLPTKLDVYTQSILVVDMMLKRCMRTRSWSQ